MFRGMAAAFVGALFSIASTFPIKILSHSTTKNCFLLPKRHMHDCDSARKCRLLAGPFLGMTHPPAEGPGPAVRTPQKMPLSPRAQGDAAP